MRPSALCHHTVDIFAAVEPRPAHGPSPGSQDALLVEPMHLGGRDAEFSASIGRLEENRLDWRIVGEWLHGFVTMHHPHGRREE